VKKARGWHHTEAAKAKMRAAATGRRLNDATRKKIGEKSRAMWQVIKRSGCLNENVG